jgi:hypothetical protein
MITFLAVLAFLAFLALSEAKASTWFRSLPSSSQVLLT